MNLWQRMITVLGVVGAIATILALAIHPSDAFAISIGLLVISEIWVVASWRKGSHAQGDNKSAFKRWCQNNLELASKYDFTKGRQTVLKVWEQFFEKGRVLLNATNDWTLVFHGESSSFMRLSNPEAIISSGPQSEIINETYLSELLLKVTDQKNRVVYEKLARAKRLVGGIGTIYIRDDMLRSLGMPLGSEFRTENVLRVQANRAELLIGIPHQFGSSVKAILLITEDGGRFSKFEWQG